MERVEVANLKMSRREKAILLMAERETLPEYADEFQPIVRGPFYALLGLAWVLPLAALCAALHVFRRVIRWPG